VTVVKSMQFDEVLNILLLSVVYQEFFAISRKPFRVRYHHICEPFIRVY